MSREEEERQTNDALEFNEGAKHDEEGRPEVAFFLYQGITGDDDGGNGDVELLHEERREQCFGTEPKHEHLLPTAECAPRYSEVEGQREGDTPENQAYGYGH